MLTFSVVCGNNNDDGQLARNRTVWDYVIQGSIIAILQYRMVIAYVPIPMNDNRVKTESVLCKGYNTCIILSWEVLHATTQFL